MTGFQEKGLRGRCSVSLIGRVSKERRKELRQISEES